MLKRIIIPKGRDFTLVVDHPDGIDKLEMNGSFEYTLVRKEDGETSLYQDLSEEQSRNFIQNRFLNRNRNANYNSISKIPNNRNNCHPSRYK